MTLTERDLTFRRLSTANGAAERLRTAIVTGEFAMGEPLFEQALCDTMGISRTPLRQAIFELQGQGLVEVIPYKGARVFSLSKQALSELGAFRKVLEIAALSSAMKENGPKLAQELHTIVDHMARSVDQEERRGYGRLDNSFHATVILHCSNQYLIESHESIGLRLETLRSGIQHDVDTVGRSIEQHREIANLITKNNVDQAAYALSEHIDAGTRFFLSRFAKNPSPTDEGLGEAPSQLDTEEDAKDSLRSAQAVNSRKRS